MDLKQFKKERDEYAHAKYDIVEEFELKLYDCFNDLAPLSDSSYEEFNYFQYDNEYDGVSLLLPDHTRYIITIPGHVIELWFEGKVVRVLKIHRRE